MFTGKVVLAVLTLLQMNLVALLLQSNGSEVAAVNSGDVTIDWTDQKVPATHMFVSPTPADYMKIIDDEKQLLRAKIRLDSSTVVEFHETPKDIDFYDSTVVVNRQGVPSRSYNVGKLIKHQALSLAHVGIVRSGDDTGMLICEYEGGAVGAREGFAILKFSPTGFELHTLPLTEFGKVVVFRSRPDQAEIWSALPEGAGSDADPMAYSTRACHWEPKDYVCGPPKRQPGRFGPAAIDDPGIEIR
jgi:hypothetical protein